MKKLLLAFFLYVSVIFTASAPPTNVLAIPSIQPIDYYEPLMKAISMYESGNDTLAYNEHEQAYGPFQIRQCRIDHYNRLNGTNYTLKDCYNFELSRKIFRYFTWHDASGKVIRPKSWEQAAKNWNGSGPMTIDYWKNVNNLII